MLVCVVLLVSTSCVSRFVERNLEGQVIATLDIKFDGPEEFDLNHFNQFIKSHPGTQYSEKILGDDLRRLSNSGLVDEARFIAGPSDGRVHLVAEICSRPAGWHGKSSPPRSRRFAITDEISKKP